MVSLSVQTAVYQYGAMDSKGQVPSFDRSLSPMLPSDALDPSVFYVPNVYQQPYFYGDKLYLYLFSLVHSRIIGISITQPFV